MSIQIYSSPRQDILFQKLLAHLVCPLSDPLAPEIIALETPGLAHWLKQELAKALGICANLACPNLQTLHWQLLQRLLPELVLPPEPRYNAQNMTWALLDLLEKHRHDPVCAPLDSYLGRDTALKRLQLAKKITLCYEKYLLFRPSLIQTWDQGAEPNDWQAFLWRAITQILGPDHPVALQTLALQKIQAQTSRLDLPERLTLYGLNGLNSLPPLIHELLQALVPHLTLAFFSLSLSSPPPSEPLPLFSPNAMASQNLLTKLKSCLLKGVSEAATPDQSITIHNLHSPQRELEALKNFLLARLDADPHLEPREILVLAPQIQPYTPLIPGIFGDGKISIRISEQTLSQQSPVFKAFGDVLGLVGSRMTLSEILSLLEQPIIHQTFGFKESELSLCRLWLEQVRVRWGIDQQQRESLDIPAFEENTFQQGLERLLMGYAIPSQGQFLVNQILPYDDLEGGQAQTLGKLLNFTQTLFAELSALQAARPLSQWTERLRQLPALFLSPAPEQAQDLQQVFQALEDLSSSQSLYPNPVPLSLVRSQLRQYFQDAPQFMGFSGQVCFGSLEALQGVPCKLLCLLGMNLGFPEQAESLAFDRLKLEPEPTDPQPRHAQRLQFLSSLLNARERLYLSFTGQSLKDNTPRPPSVLVSELLDKLEEMTGLGENHWMTRHPLHPFDPLYFQPGPLQSFSAQHHAIYQRLYCQPRLQALPFSEPHPCAALNEVNLSALIQFFSNPCQWYLQAQLQIVYPRQNQLLEDTEIFALNSLEKYQLQEEMLESLQTEQNLDQLKILKKAAHALPVGPIGEIQFEQQGEAVQLFYQALLPYLSDESRNQRFFLQLPNAILTGQISHLQAEARVVWRLSSIKPKDLLRHWLSHLVLNLQEDPRLPRQTVILGFDAKSLSLQKQVLPPLSDPEPLLTNLLALFLQGQTEPLPFYPEAAFIWASETRKGTEFEQKLKKLEQAWIKGQEPEKYGEGLDPYIQRCFRNSNFFSTRFQTLAEQVYTPLLEVLHD